MWIKKYNKHILSINWNGLSVYRYTQTFYVNVGLFNTPHIRNENITLPIPSIIYIFTFYILHKV